MVQASAPGLYSVGDPFFSPEYSLPGFRLWDSSAGATRLRFCPVEDCIVSV
jgi:hypothetical protein